MKKGVMIFDVPTVEGGALAILNDFYSEVLSNSNKDIDWIFVVSEPELEEKDNVKILKYPWIKKSWFHRLYFDHFLANKLIKEYKIDRILSLQNIVIPYTKIPQTIYLHQSLPFVEYRFKLKENVLFWIYQNIIGKIIKRSITRAEKVIVQTEWMKEACIDQTGVDSKKIKVIPPKINIDTINKFIPNEDNLRRFFFPAGPMSYKNHMIIIGACKILKEKGIKNYRVIFTLRGDESKYIMNLHKEVIDNFLPIDFIGFVSREKVFELYGRSILIFPSYIETFGLPMLESKLHGGIALASNRLFSKEILDGYENAYFFDPFAPKELSGLMEEILNSRIKYKKIEEEIGAGIEKGWKGLINDICL